jgi:hypothetical protein
VKKLICLLAVLVMILGASLSAGAFSIDADGSYLFGLGSDPKGQGFAAHAKAQITGEFFADAAFSYLNFKGKDSTTRQDTLFTVGALYRVAKENDLQVFVGAGYGMFSFKAAGPEATDGDPTSAQGIYGKFAVKLVPADKVTLLADVGYAPKFKSGDTAKNLITARATVSYELMDNISVQGTVKHYRTGDYNSGILVGGGVSVSF